MKLKYPDFFVEIRAHHINSNVYYYYYKYVSYALTGNYPYIACGPHKAPSIK